MLRPLSEPIAHLEQKIESFKSALAAPDLTDAKRVDLRLDLDLAEGALAHFRKAFELEQRLSSDNPVV